VFSLLVNPAAMIRTQQSSFFALGPTLSSPQTTFGLVDSIFKAIDGDGTGDLGKALKPISDSGGKLVVGLNFNEFPLSIANVANGFGWGVWNTVSTVMIVNGVNIDARLYADVIAPVGIAFKVLDTEKHSVDAGVTLKPFLRGYVDEKFRVTDLLGDSSKSFDNLKVPLMFGIGLDLGFLYRWDIGELGPTGHSFAAGITFTDIFTRGWVITDLGGKATGAVKGSGEYMVPFAINLGVAYTLNLFNIVSITAAIDWHNFTNVFEQDNYMKRNAALNIGAGLQASVFGIFKASVGIRESLPAVGLGVDLGPIEISVAYYGREYGLEPGQFPAAALDFTFAVRPGVAKKDWPWTQRSLVELINGN